MHFLSAIYRSISTLLPIFYFLSNSSSKLQFITRVRKIANLNFSTDLVLPILNAHKQRVDLPAHSKQTQICILYIHWNSYWQLEPYYKLYWNNQTFYFTTVFSRLYLHLPNNRSVTLVRSKVLELVSNFIQQYSASFPSFRASLVAPIWNYRFVAFVHHYI